MVEVYQETEKKRYKDLLFLAWHTAAFTGRDKLPSLEEIYSKIDAPKMDDISMFETAKRLNAIFGGKEV